jgi:ABC-2 type transport system permease protein
MVDLLPEGHRDVIAIELTKQLRRARGWVTLGLVAAVALLLTVVIGATRGSLPERIGDWGSVTTDTSGLAVPLVAINAMMLFLLPLAVAISAGESVAGDASWGSLRYLLMRPVKRARVLTAKAVVALGFSVANVLAAVTVSLLAGVIAFGWQPLTVVDLQHSTPLHIAAATFGAPRALALVLVTTGFVLCSMASTFAFALFVSTLTDRAFSAVAAGVGLGLVSRALDNIPGLHSLSPWLPVTDSGTSAWTGLFTSPAQSGPIAHALIVQLAYGAAFLVAAWAWFTRSDMLH